MGTIKCVCVFVCHVSVCVSALVAAVVAAVPTPCSHRAHIDDVITPPPPHRLCGDDVISMTSRGRSAFSTDYPHPYACALT